eukprot:TRINITY_DN3505_c0_g3_i1.p1 TRINITY_DN3505_c0_g3~~TRINITY_DN3505_c0_g3_i1.p1  ORF type:complete len:462 (-),score=177.29 TRINITY_DN3505_c0_g3_i1:18-1403(-)
MSSGGDPFSILNKDPERAKFRLPEVKATVKRYRPGQLPEFLMPKDGTGSMFDDDDDEGIEAKSITHFSETRSVAPPIVPAETPQRAPEIIERRRIHRSEVVTKDQKQPEVKQEVKQEAKQEVKQEEIFAEPRRRAVEVQPAPKPKEVEVAPRRGREELKARLLEQERLRAEKQKEQAQELFGLKKEEEEEEEEAMEEEEQADEDEDEETMRERHEAALRKPIFVPRVERDQLPNGREDDDAILAEEARRIQEKKRKEAKDLFMETIKAPEREDKDEESGSDREMPPDDDDQDKEEQFEAWKIRELKRIKRDREEVRAREKERAEIERRRQMTDEERNLENQRLGCDAIKPEQQKHLYMQKYYHAGAFYQDNDDPIFKRDYNMPVGEDLFDKSTLPRILQVRRGDWGKRSRSKYTHLVDQDTTNFDPQYKVHELVHNKMLGQLAGYKGNAVLERPSKKKTKL